MAVYTTLNDLYARGMGNAYWHQLLAHLNKFGPDDEPLSMGAILEGVGLEQALILCEVLGVEHESAIRLMACDMGETSLTYTDAPWAHEAFAVARRFANGEATEEDLAAANNATWGLLTPEKEPVSKSCARKAAQDVTSANARTTAYLVARHTQQAAAAAARKEVVCSWRDQDTPYLAGKAAMEKVIAQQEVIFRRYMT